MAEGFVDNWELTGAEHLYYTGQDKGNEGGAVMEKTVKRPSRVDGLLQDGVQEGNAATMSDPDQLKESIAIDLEFLSEAELTYVLSRVEAFLLMQQLSPTGQETDSQGIP